MKSFLSSLLVILLTQICHAQYTEVINSRRPGFSDSPYSVGTKVYQVEGGLFYKNVGRFEYWDPILEQTITYGASSFGTDIMLRTGQFFEKLEFNLDMAVVSENRDYTRPAVYTDSGFGFSKMTLGAKYLVYKPEYADKSKEIRSWKARHSFDKKRLIPAVGVYAGLNTNLLTDLHKNPEGISPRFAIYTQNDLSERLIVLLNLIADKAFTNEAENSYIITVTYTLFENWSIFGENQGFFRKNVPNDFQFGAGGAYLINPNMQADFSARMIVDSRGDNTYLVGGGVSWRLDKHKDQVIVTTPENDEINVPQQKKSFFDTITFGLFAGNKSSNSGKMREVKTSKVKPRELQAPVNKKAQKARKKASKQAEKERKQREKAQKKQK
ncbi:transporter [Lutimonas zeaxanthinifaciens]|uniref:transporter n=1 Tax=Lutimonas zeaxanthinifaciens TaxID=3060215 RepID=UPI00265CD3E5|nr:transporter [Lutimonas sp. YSD2104]WKK65204.1 transporter [Lutimonas sp. YSD2104]